MQFKSLLDYTANELPPNPQFFRDGWIDLCGDWGFAHDDEDCGIDAGWPDRAEEWLGPDAVWKRVEWSTRLADRLGRFADARALARESLGPVLAEASRRQIERAADGPQALALLLLAPEFQRR